MRLERLFASLSAIAVAAIVPSSHPAAQDAQPSGRTFRARVDLITLDVAVVDANGRPVEDLRAGDFAVKVDGKSRPVVSAELVKVDTSRAAESSAAPADPLVSTNIGAERGRRVVVAVDQTLVVPGSIATVMRSALRFVDKLAPSDYAAVLAFPEPGPRVDFTTDKARARDALRPERRRPRARVRTSPI